MHVLQDTLIDANRPHRFDQALFAVKQMRRQRAEGRAVKPERGRSPFARFPLVPSSHAVQRLATSEKIRQTSCFCPLLVHGTSRYESKLAGRSADLLKVEDIALRVGSALRVLCAEASLDSA